MKPFVFAIASIVDANTGGGLARRAGAPDYRAYEQRARRLRSKSIVASIDGFRARLAAVAAEYRLRAKQRRDLRDLKRLSDRLLDDVGLSRRDLLSVELGATTLAELDARRRPSRVQAAGDAGQAADSGPVSRLPEAVNASYYDARKCA